MAYRAMYSSPCGINLAGCIHSLDVSYCCAKMLQRFCSCSFNKLEIPSKVVVSCFLFSRKFQECLFGKAKYLIKNHPLQFPDECLSKLRSWVIQYSAVTRSTRLQIVHRFSILDPYWKHIFTYYMRCKLGQRIKYFFLIMNPILSLCNYIIVKFSDRKGSIHCHL